MEDAEAGVGVAAWAVCAGSSPISSLVLFHYCLCALGTRFTMA